MGGGFERVMYRLKESPIRTQHRLGNDATFAGQNQDDQWK